MLQKPKDSLGYTKEELKQICKERKISFRKFNNAFGINTVTIAKDGTPRFYSCDVKRALYNLGHTDGEYFAWD